MITRDEQRPLWNINDSKLVSGLSLSVYEVKNNCRLFERFFTIKKNGVFLFGISFFVIEIFTFLYYANEESDDVIDGSTKTVQHSINNISRNIGAVFFKTTCELSIYGINLLVFFYRSHYFTF